MNLSSQLSPVQRLKISCLSRGIAIEAEARRRLTRNGSVALSIHEYATTGGLTLRFADGQFVNAPFDEWYCDAPQATLTVGRDGDYRVQFHDDEYPVEVLPLPGYLERIDSRGRAVKDSVMSHVDRARLSPIGGCSFTCKFCDCSLVRSYVVRPVEQLLEALSVAVADPALIVRHVLISGGTPAERDRPYYEDTCRQIIQATDLPVDVMFVPYSPAVIDRLCDGGAHGFAINLELHDVTLADELMPHKSRAERAHFVASVERAMERTGGNGRVRSLILLGLEPLESTLQGVEFLARLGCDPVLSPFRPAAGTRLADVRPPEPEFLARAYLEAVNIVERHGVKLGPRCIPCEHNTLTFPDNSGAYYYS